MIISYNMVIFMCFQHYIAIPVKPYAIKDYRSLKRALGYYEDTYLNFTELTTKYGYESETHEITTDDGYMLTIFRIITKCDHVQVYPVILAHGIYDSSDTWVFTGPKKGLGYILSDYCYDVWVVNFRGNTYSRKHIRLNPDNDPEYWEFSFDENGYFDLPAIIDYVIEDTKCSKVYYIGHSQGTTDFFAMGSLRPEYNEKIRLSIQLAPIAWMRHLRIPLPKFIARENKSVKNILNFIGLRELFAKQQLMHGVIEVLCQIFPNEVCGTFLTFATGYVQRSITSKDLSVASGHLFSGSSVKTLAHFGQLIASGNFLRYDEGEEQNLKKYGTIKPPKYNVSHITSPVVLLSAENDYLSTFKDINILSSKLPNLYENYIVPERTWSHNNYLWGINATEYVNDKILYYLGVFNT